VLGVTLTPFSPGDQKEAAQMLLKNGVDELML